ncbi:MAG: hypothetical protein ACRBK7_12405, partial [Acidimicrobiales bacterium]
MTSLLVMAMVAAACGSADISSSADGTVDGAADGSIVEPSNGLERAAVDPGAPVGALVAGFGDAGFELMRTQAVDENLVFSPLSIGHALLMARAAAD